MRRVLIGVVVLAVLGVGGALAAFLLIGGDAPPPPKLSEPDADATPAPAEAGKWTVVEGAPSFVGYRVREEFASFGGQRRRPRPARPGPDRARRQRPDRLRQLRHRAAERGRLRHGPGPRPARVRAPNLTLDWSLMASRIPPSRRYPEAT